MCEHRGPNPPLDSTHEDIIASNDSLGLQFLISGSTDVREDKYPDLMRPPIGLKLDRTVCPKRCEGFTYRLAEEAVNPGDIWHPHFYAYFPSTEVEQWTESGFYSVLGFLSDVGGVLGLLLGSSLLSVARMVVDVLRGGCGQVFFLIMYIFLLVRLIN